LLTPVTTNIFIDIFIGIWAFILAVVWTTVIERRAGEKPRKLEIRFRFPKFVLGYFPTFLVLLAIALSGPATLASARVAAGEMNALRILC